jgi:chromosome segregation ATPase
MADNEQGKDGSSEGKPNAEPAKTTGSALKDLVLTMLPSRIRRRTLAAQASSVPLDRAIAVRDERIAELERMADERLHALNVMDVSVNALRHEAEKRECGLHELAAIIAARDARIAELEEVAGRRLDALNAMDVSFSTLQYEADERERGLHELTAIIAGRDARIAELAREIERHVAERDTMTRRLVVLESETLLRYALRRMGRSEDR